MSYVTVMEKPETEISVTLPKRQTKRYVLKMSANGQITIPKEMREELGWQVGDTLTFVPVENGVGLHKQQSLRDEMKEWRENLSLETKSMIKKMAGWTMEQYHEHFDNLPENIEERERRYGFKAS